MSRNIKKIVVIYEKNDKTNEKLIIGFDIYGQIFNVKSSNTLEEYKQNIEDCYKKARDYLKDVYNLDLDREYTKENIKTQEIATSENNKAISSIKNLKYYDTCRNAVLDGTQITLQKSSYTLGKTLEGASNVGKRRTNQEDSYLILEHPKDENIKLLAVADGVGGEANGEQASNYLLKRLIPFFEMLPKKYFEDVEYLKELFNQELYKINEEMVKQRTGSTTLSLALVLKDKTLIFNAGDSGIYSYSKLGLKKLTRDDSLVQNLYEEGEIKDEDLMRFHTSSNVITSCFGGHDLKLSSKVIPNKYNILLLASDGVTDCLSKQELKKLLKAEQKDNLADKIVNKALETNSYCEQGLVDQEYYYEIKGGKDNTTAVVLKRK